MGKSQGLREQKVWKGVAVLPEALEDFLSGSPVVGAARLHPFLSFAVPMCSFFEPGPPAWAAVNSPSVLVLGGSKVVARGLGFYPHVIMAMRRLFMYICMYIHTYTYVCVCTYISIDMYMYESTADMSVTADISTV